MILKVISANSVDPDQTVCQYAKNSFEKFARIFSRRHVQTTFSDAVFLGTLRVNKALKKIAVFMLTQPTLFQTPDSATLYQEKCKIKM